MTALQTLPSALRWLSRAAGVALCAALVATPSPAAPQSGKLAIKAGKILPRPGAPAIENGVIVIVDGRISAIGDADTEIPWDAEVIDAPDWVAFPGFVEALTSSGIDRPNENVDVAPFLKVSDSLDPVSFFFEDALRWGMTTINVQQGSQTVIAGQGLIVKPTGLTVEDMLVSDDAGIALSATPKRGNSSATQLQALRGAFDDLHRYLEDLVQENKDNADQARREALYQGRELEGEAAKGRAMEGSAWKVDGLERVPRGEVDEKQAPLLALVEGRTRAFFYAARAMDVVHALAVARENGFLAKTVLVLDGDAWKAADRIAEAGVPVIWNGDVTDSERDVITGELKETFVPGELDRHGVRFALSSQNPSSQSLWYQAALSVGRGLPREKAIAAVTTVPAEILGLGKRVGSLEVGKDGNVLLLSGDPLSVTSWVERVVIEGKPVYDRSKDIRIQHLLEGKTPPGTTPMGTTGEPEAHVHPDFDGSGDPRHPQPDEQDEHKKDEKEGKGGEPK